MAHQRRRPAASAKANGSDRELAGASLDLINTPHAEILQSLSTPRSAMEAMQVAGAVFTVRRRDDALEMSFSYSVQAGGDLDRCRAILASVKARPAAFFQAFRYEVQRSAPRSNGGVA